MKRSDASFAAALMLLATFVGVQAVRTRTPAVHPEVLTASFPADTRFTNLAADIQVDAGTATFKPLHAAVPGIALTGDGNYDLVQKHFDATFKARLSPELEQLDHACRVSKRLTALDVPVNCSGTLGTEPATWCSVDATKIVNTVLVSMFEANLLGCTIVLRHWAGRNSRGVTQFEGKTINSLISSPTFDIDQNAAVAFLHKLIAL